MLWGNAGNSCGVSSAVRMGIVGGRGTLAGAESSVVA